MDYIHLKYPSFHVRWVFLQDFKQHIFLCYLLVSLNQFILDY